MNQSNTELSRFKLESSAGEEERDLFAFAIREGFSREQKSLPCRYLYDDEGSRLFEAIGEQPEYYLMRCEREILDLQGAAIAECLTRGSDGVEFVELGAGNSSKTKVLLQALHGQIAALRYVPIDVNADVMRRGVGSWSHEMEHLQVLALAMGYDEGIARLQQVPAAGRRVLAWLGSSAANMGRDETASALRFFGSCLGAGDRVLLGIDKRKDPKRIEAAYDDSAGVSAAFAKNLLTRVNSEFGANFDIEAFDYLAEYDNELGRVGMYLVSRKAQEVRLAALDWTVTFAAGERLHTEDSYKYSIQEIEELGKASGLTLEQSWLDTESLYAVALLRR
ncbi:MAG: L-histidine N-alpha-methyltransferase [Planctomycetota bacterium]|jgi:L-histidine N-alpha-methyltransferase